ncbi:RHS repeat-associated core domain-containing protein, partial [Candidatus Parcubacteria bacterium]
YFDAETGLNYNYQRTYDPALGRYTQSDPIGLNGGMNPFGYVGGNPVALYDPYGLYCLSPQAINAIAGGIGGAFSGFIAGVQSGNPYLAIAGLILGGGAGGTFGYFGTTSSGEALISGAASSVASGLTTPGGSVFGGAFGGGLSYQLQSGGLRDSYAGIIGGAVGGALGGYVSGFLSYNALRSGAIGGLVGLSGAALSAAITEALRSGNDCGCSK